MLITHLELILIDLLNTLTVSLSRDLSNLDDRFGASNQSYSIRKQTNIEHKLISVQKQKRDERLKEKRIFTFIIVLAMKGFCFRKKVYRFFVCTCFFACFFICFSFSVCCEYRFHLLHVLLLFRLFSNWIHYDNFYFSAFISELKKEAKTTNNTQIHSIQNQTAAFSLKEVSVCSKSESYLVVCIRSQFIVLTERCAMLPVNWILINFSSLASN